MIDDKKDLSLNYKIYWITAAILLVVGFIKGGDSAIDIQLHDTYFVFGLSFVYNLISLAYFIFGLIYFIAVKKGIKLNPFLSKLHCFGTLTLLLILFWNPLLINFFHPRRYYAFEGMDPGFYTNSISQVTILLVMMASLQVIYILNLFKKRKME